MVDSKQILKATGIKSAKTLTRWHTSGFIPKPTIGTSRSGRGKVSYWPDWVLNRCKRIVELQKQGHSPKSAVMVIELERVHQLIDEVKSHERGRLSHLKVKMASGSEVALGDLFAKVVLAELEPVVSSDTLRKVAHYLQASDSMTSALELIKSGYNPVLCVGTGDVQLTADFVVSHWLSTDPLRGSPLVCLPLLAPLRKLFDGLGRRLPPEQPVMLPTKTIFWKTPDGSIHQVDFDVAGLFGFEVRRETERELPGE